jgi:hypothetical protein
VRTQRWVKLPFRIGRAVVRAVRDELRAEAAGRPPAAPAPVPAAGPVGSAPTPAVEPAPAAAPPPAAPAVDVRIEETPNPDALKFVCSAAVVREGSMAFNDADNARGVPFAEAIFRLDGIRTVFATKDFVTVTRRTEAPPWPVLAPAIADALKATVGR